MQESSRGPTELKHGLTIGGRIRSVLDLAATVSIISVSAIMAWVLLDGGRSGRREPAQAGQPALPEAPLSLAGAHLKGSEDAKVAIVEYADFECPYCGTFARDVLPELDRRYIATGKVLFAFRHYPLAIHPGALKAAQSAYCAGQQGSFWPFHDLLFKSPRRLDPNNLSEHAARLNLSVPGLEGCVSGEAPGRVQQDIENGRNLQLSGTPTFFIGALIDGRVKVSQRIVGSVSLQRFKDALSQLIR
jgi:protein-disulfide isomerase